MTQLLPGNASAFELAFVQWWSDLVADPSRSLVDVHGAFTCPAELLPWLANEMAVREWAPDMPEAVRRQLIADQFVMLEKAGTGEAINLAVSGLGFSPDVVPWYKQDPPAEQFTLAARAWLTGQVPGEAAVQQALFSRLGFAVSARDTYTLEMAMATEAGLQVGSTGGGFSVTSGAGQDQRVSRSGLNLVTVGGGVSVSSGTGQDQRVSRSGLNLAAVGGGFSVFTSEGIAL